MALGGVFNKGSRFLAGACAKHPYMVVGAAGAGIGATGGALMNGDDPWAGAAQGALVGAAGGIGGRGLIANRRAIARRMRMARAVYGSKRG